MMGAISANVPVFDLSAKRMAVSYCLPNHKRVCCKTFARFVGLSRSQVTGLVRRVREGAWFRGYKHGLVGEASNKAMLPGTEARVVAGILDLAEDHSSMDPSGASANTKRRTGKLFSIYQRYSPLRR